MILRWRVLALIPVMLANALAAEPAKLMPPVVETLPNGLEIAWFPDPKVPLVDIGLFVWSGSVDDPDQKSGTAQLLSSCLFRGAAGMSAKELAAATEKLGASRYASASEEDLALGFHGLSEDAPELLALLAKVALRPDLLQKEVDEQKARTADRWRHLRDYGDTLAGLAFSRRLTAGTAYGRGSFVSLAEFQKVTRDDLKTYHEKYFRPDNAILLISGRVDRESLRKVIAREFGGDSGHWTRSKTVPGTRNRYSEPRLARVKERILLVDRPQLTQTSIRVGFRAPLLSSPDHYPLLVLNALVGEHFSSRLNSLLRDQLGLTYAVGSAFSFERDLTVFSISSSTRNETAAQVISRTLSILTDIRNGKISAEEVETAKQYLTGTFAISAASPSSSVSRWLMGRMFNLGPDYLNEYLPKIRAVTHEQVVQAAKRHMDPDSAVITAAGDAKAIESGLRALKLKPYRRITVEELL